MPAKKTRKNRQTRRKSWLKSPFSGSRRGKKKAQTRSKANLKGRKGTIQKTPVHFIHTTIQAIKNVSNDRKLDILGVIFSFIGVGSLLSMLSENRSLVTGRWIAFLGTAFGLAGYLFPLGLLAIGLWLVLRSFERTPRLSLGRAAGIGLLYLLLLTLLHVANRMIVSVYLVQPSALFQGGGLVGKWIHQVLASSLGFWGEAIVFLIGLIIGLALTLERSVLDIFSWLPYALRYTGRRLEVWVESLAIPRGRRSPRPAHRIDKPLTEAQIESQGIPQNDSDPGQPVVIQQESDIPEQGALPWVCPTIESILDEGEEINADLEYDTKRAKLIEETLESFGAPAKVVEINRGPTVTQFGVEPAYTETRNSKIRVRVSKIANLADDLTLALASQRIRIQAPVPGKGYVGIEVPNEEIQYVAELDVIKSKAFKKIKSPLAVALGMDVAGHPVAVDLAAMPHVLIAGATGSGKSVCVNAFISCLLIHNTPDELRLVMVDPKRVELTGYNGIPHLLAPVIVELERVVGVLQWVLREMDQRYHKFSKAGSRNIKEFNSLLLGEGKKKLPHIVVIIDELADLMMLSPEETERCITRMAQLARATGIHLVISTQRPSVDVVTGLIKANIPARISFAVVSNVESRVILDQPGAERLLGRGDMLFQSPDAPSAVRLQGVYVSDVEIQRLVHYWLGQARPVQAAAPDDTVRLDPLQSGLPLKQLPIWENMEPDVDTDVLYDEATDLVRREGRASISMLQRRFRIGYTRAARLIETMEETGIIEPLQPGAKSREVLDYGSVGPPADD